MTEKDLADLFLKGIDKLEFYWNFYVVFVIAIVGFYAKAEKPFSLKLRSILLCGYVFFAFMNVMALHSSYSFVQALQQDLMAKAACSDQLQALMPETLRVLKEQDYAFSRRFMYGIHTFMAIAFTLLTVFQGRLLNSGEQAEEN